MIDPYEVGTTIRMFEHTGIVTATSPQAVTVLWDGSRLFTHERWWLDDNATVERA